MEVRVPSRSSEFGVLLLVFGEWVMGLLGYWLIGCKVERQRFDTDTDSDPD
jgi:hypothetical protein